MAIFEHFCDDCGFNENDNEHLLVCPNCSSSNISNVPDETGNDLSHIESDDEIKQE